MDKNIIEERSTWMANITRNIVLHTSLGGISSADSQNILSEAEGVYDHVPMAGADNYTASWQGAAVRGVVLRPASPDQATFYLSAVALGLVAINLVGAGGQVDGEECVRLLKKPVALGIGMLCRFGVIPALTLGIVELIQPDRNSSIGILSLTCSPAEGASSLLVLLAEGDLTFSVTLTSVNNFATTAMLPLWTILFETQIYSRPGNVSIPFKESFIVFCYIVTACMAGFLLQKKLTSIYHKLWTYLPGVTMTTVGFILIVEIYNNSFVFPLITIKAFFVSLLVACCGFGSGAAVAFLTRMSRSRILVNCLECGVRTTYITGILLVTSLPTQEANKARTTPVICSVFSLLPALIFVIVFRVYQLRYDKNYINGTVFVTATDEEVAQCLAGQDPIMEEKETCI